MTVNIFGATGLIGNLLLHASLEHPRITLVRIFVRKPVAITHEKLVQVTTTYETLDQVSGDIKGDVVFNCLGTTIKQAGSEAAQYEIDCLYPAKVARLAAANGVPAMINVSSVGTTANGNFYLKTKYDMETAVSEAISRAWFMRPSLLTGQRTGFRLGERIAMWIMPLLDLLLFGGLRKYHSIKAETVARAMLALAIHQPEQPKVLHYDEMVEWAKK